MDDLEGVFNYPHRQYLLAAVAALHHHWGGQTLHDGAGSLAETLGLVAARRVRQILGMLLLDGHVIL